MRYAIEMLDGSIQIMTVFPQKMLQRVVEDGKLISEEEIEVFPDPQGEINKWCDEFRLKVKSIRPALDGEESSHRQ